MLNFEQTFVGDDGLFSKTFKLTDEIAMKIAKEGWGTKGKDYVRSHDARASAEMFGEQTAFAYSNALGTEVYLAYHGTFNWEGTLGVLQTGLDPGRRTRNAKMRELFW